MDEGLIPNGPRPALDTREETGVVSSYEDVQTQYTFVEYNVEKAQGGDRAPAEENDVMDDDDDIPVRQGTYA